MSAFNFNAYIQRDVELELVEACHEKIGDVMTKIEEIMEEGSIRNMDATLALEEAVIALQSIVYQPYWKIKNNHDREEAMRNSNVLFLQQQQQWEGIL